MTLPFVEVFLVRNESDKKVKSLHLKMSDLHCEQHSSGKDNRASSKRQGRGTSELKSGG